MGKQGLWFNCRAFCRGFGKGFTDFGLLISDAVVLSALTLTYFSGIGIVAVVARIAGKHFLNDKTKHDAKSYYIIKKIGGENKDAHYKQY